MDIDKQNRIEKLLWSIAFPGFGQILNRKIVKGLLFITLEVIINVIANLNKAIVLSFQGDNLDAVEVTNYQWLMFYPCIYMFAIWDAYRDAGGHSIPYAFFPFVISAYAGTIGVIYSSVFQIKGILFGPVWLPIICLTVGALFGFTVQVLLTINK